MLSIIIPSRNERFLAKTVEDLLVKASGPVEILAVLDGYWCDPPLQEDKRLHILHRGKALGMRAAINAAAVIAKGDYLLKCDAHTMWGEGYDEILARDCGDNEVVIPSRYSLDAENWCIANNGKSRVDYHYLSYPYPPGMPSGCGLHGVVWNQRARERLNKPEFEIDEEMSFQGSAWFTTKKHFEWLGGLDERLYGVFMGEPQEIGLKTWLGGGRCLTNKRTSYCHLYKGKRYGRGYNLPGGERERYSLIASYYWMSNLWKQRKYDLQWLIQKFWPVPTWPHDVFDHWDSLIAEHPLEPELASVISRFEA